MMFAAWAVACLLAVFTLRRYLYWAASCLPRRDDRPSYSRSVTVLVAARNEKRLLPRLLDALTRLDYPQDRLHFVLISDGSQDGTEDLFQNWAAGRAQAKVICLPASVGKGAALRLGQAAAPKTELVAVMDADTVPEPDSLARLAGAFDHPRVGAACGYPEPHNADESMTSRYAALERWTFHLVTLAGKDKLGANPPAIGALCCFRREALEEAGGFPIGAAAEDIFVSLEITRRGWRTRWIREAVTREDVATQFATFRHQRGRWSRGLLASGGRARSLEDVLVAAGYLDRLVLLAGVGLAAVQALPWWLPAAYLLAPTVSIAFALLRAKPKSVWRCLLAIPPFLLADVGVTITSALAQIKGGPVRWAERGASVRAESPARPESVVRSVPGSD